MESRTTRPEAGIGQGATPAPPAGDSEPQDGSTVENAKQAVSEQAQGAAEKARSAAREQVDQRTTQAGERVSGLAGDLRSVGEQLRSQENEPAAKAADAVADRAERAGRYLTEVDGDRLLSDVEDFGRRQPWLVLAGGVALGVAAARFLKASSSERYGARSAQRQDATRELPNPSAGSATYPSGASASAHPAAPIDRPAGVTS